MRRFTFVLALALSGVALAAEVESRQLTTYLPQDLLETVVRTLKVGHPLTQGTTDSNELWLEVTAMSGGHPIGRSGALDEDVVDPRAHFVNVYMLDREGRRVDRRNVQDIFVPLYDHQIPPSAAAVVHYQLDVPADARQPIEVDVKPQYRRRRCR